MAFNMDDYVDVASRITEFYAKFPDGRLSTRSVEIVEGGAIAIAEAYRTADDPHPGVGTAWEPIPGKTSFTRDSEVQNAETAAWGRAIIAAGIPAKKIASMEEVKARQPEESKKAARGKRDASPAPAAAESDPPTSEQMRIIYACRNHTIDDELRHRLIRRLTEGRTQSVKDIADEHVDKIVEQLNYYAMNPKGGLAALQEWERETAA
jgi:hypothetical protein